MEKNSVNFSISPGLSRQGPHQAAAVRSCVARRERDLKFPKFKKVFLFFIFFIFKNDLHVPGPEPLLSLNVHRLHQQPDKLQKNIIIN